MTTPSASNPIIELASPQAVVELQQKLKRFLHEVPSAFLARGRQYVRERRVQISHVTEKNIDGIVTNAEGTTYNLHFNLEKAEATASCSCPIGMMCKHCAAMAMEVGSVISGEKPAPDNHRGIPQKKSRPDPVRIPIAFRSRLPEHYPLTDELVYEINKIQFLWAKYTGSGKLEDSDIRALLEEPYSYGENRELDIFPRKPRDLFEFWQFVAAEISRRGKTIPDVLEPVTDVESVKEEILQHESLLKVEELKYSLEMDFNDEQIKALRGVEIRLKIKKDSFELMAKDLLSTQFTPMPKSFLKSLPYEKDYQRSITSDRGRRLARFTHESYMRSGSNFGPSDALTTEISGIIQDGEEGQYLLNSKGADFVRSPDLLIAKLTPADNAGFYSLELELSNGQPRPYLIFTTAERDTALGSHFLSDERIYAGPWWPADRLNMNEKHILPERFLTSATGKRMLQKMGVGQTQPELVRAVTPKLKVSLKTEKSTQQGANDLLYVRSKFIFSDTKSFTLHDRGWVRESEGVGDGPLLDEDVAKFPAMAKAFANFSFIFDKDEQQFVARVTKDFPERFFRFIEALPSEANIELSKELRELKEGSTIEATWEVTAIRTDLDWFDIYSGLQVHETILTKDELKLLLAARGKFVNLPGKGWRRLHIDDAKAQVAAQFGIVAPLAEPVRQRIHALQVSDEVAEQAFSTELKHELLARRKAFSLNRETPVPASFVGTLRPYQVEGFRFLSYLSENNFGGILADDMGLGKTVQTLAWIVHLFQKSGDKSVDPGVKKKKHTLPAQKVLVVCPKSVVDNWISEAKRFAPQLRVSTLVDEDRFETTLSENDIVVVNYSRLRTLQPKNTFLAIVLDEGQFIKNPDSQTALAARALNAKYRVVLTGTPVENRPLDVWSLMEFAFPGLLGPRTAFKLIFGKEVAPYAIRMLSERLKPFVIRRTKKQVAPELPERTEEDLLVELEGSQLTLYRAELKRAQQALLNVKTQSQLSKFQFYFFASLTKLRQLALHTSLVTGEAGPSSKLDALMENLEPLIESGKKVLVFSQFVEMLRLVQVELDERKWDFDILTGSTENRADVIKNFQGRAGAAVFLISLKAGGFGINLTEAEYVFLLDPWWNPAVEAQAIDRSHRIGQTKAVTAYRLIARDTIEEKVRKLQIAKQQISDALFSENAFEGSLSLKDFEFLFSD